MKLKHSQDYLSIKQFEDIDIENFSVITGLNGSGKSHLLNAINNGSIVVDNLDKDEIILYNYSDFTIFNLNLNLNQNTNNRNQPDPQAELRSKFQNFQIKSSSFSQKINDKKNQVLNNFKLGQNVQGYFIGDHIIFNNSIFEWDENDFILYEKIKEQNADFTNPIVFTLKGQILHTQILHGYPIKPIDNIREFIKEIQKLTIDLYALQFIKSGGYNVYNLNLHS